MAKTSLSRPKRWLAAGAAAQEALSAIDAAMSDLELALSDLNSIREEYEEWRDGLPGNLQASATGEKLSTIVDLKIPDDPRECPFDDLQSLIDEAESIDLPLGFGRD